VTDKEAHAMKLTKTLGLLTVITFARPAYAGEAAPTSIPPEAKKLVDPLAGKWSTNMTLTMAGHAPVKFKGTWDCRKIAGGAAVDCYLKVKVPGLGVMEETDVWAWDPESKSLHAFTVNNMGEVHDHKAAWKDDKTITFKHAATQGGKPVEEDFAMTFDAPKKMSFRFAVKAAEGTTIFEGAASRI
jgi:hypothetical protein